MLTEFAYYCGQCKGPTDHIDKDGITYCAKCHSTTLLKITRGSVGIDSHIANIILDKNTLIEYNKYKDAGILFGPYNDMCRYNIASNKLLYV